MTGEKGSKTLTKESVPQGYSKKKRWGSKKWGGVCQRGARGEKII